MIFKRWILAGVCILAALAVGPAAAQNYFFEVPRETITVVVNPDSSIDIDYRITFANSVAGDPIDIVDVGFPSDDYDLNSISADLDGRPCPIIRPSEYIDIGVEIPLSPAIAPGDTGTLHVSGRNYHMVFEDSSDETYASTVFSPTWFGSDFTFGDTRLTMTFVFPPGVTGEQTRWHEDQGGEPTQMFIQDGRVYYVWDWSGASPSDQYFFGISFPRSAVSEVRTPPRFEWITDLFGALIGLGTQFCGCLIPITIFILITTFSIINRRRRRMKYLPPKAKVEGVGIKRGLTAPEAALIMERPLNTVLTMILFGLAKKGALAVKSQTPLKFEKLAYNKNGLRPYEKKFLECVKKDGALDEAKLRDMLIEMIKAVQKKMKGFSHKETVEYYRKIVKTAWRLVEEAGTPDVKMEEFSNSLEWTMLDDDFNGRTRTIFVGYDYPTPVWWGRFAPVGTTGTSGGVGLDMPTLPGADFANSIVTRVEGIANGVVSKVESFTGTVTSKTNPRPVSTGGGFSGGGGSSCACACACAGCACACAGGGR
ncbi:MAG: hypothetical protein PVH29_09645 [Candidatus Zixiibacteriota bacterium]